MLMADTSDEGIVESTGGESHAHTDATIYDAGGLLEKPTKSVLSSGDAKIPTPLPPTSLD